MLYFSLARLIDLKKKKNRMKSLQLVYDERRKGSGGGEMKAKQTLL